jgi:hypothetical protein
MDLLWSGLARRASEYTRIERKSQFSGVHEIAFKSVKVQDQSKDI